MFKGVENFQPGLKLYIRKRKAEKHYKDKTYHYLYYELIQTFRDPNDKSRVVSKFIGFLGKKQTRKDHLEKMRRRLTGHYTINDLTKAMQIAMQKVKDFSPTTEVLQK